MTELTKNMSDKEKWMWSLAMTESHNNPDSRLGDHGRAFGRWQVHPDWVWTYSRGNSIVPRLGETWDSFIERILSAFYDKYNLNPSEKAMMFHLGHRSSVLAVDWDHDYATRFNSYLDQATKFQNGD